VAGCYECGDEPLGSCATELVIHKWNSQPVTEHYGQLFKGSTCVSVFMLKRLMSRLYIIIILRNYEI
jgi:hypothetical protein